MVEDSFEGAALARAEDLVGDFGAFDGPPLVLAGEGEADEFLDGFGGAGVWGVAIVGVGGFFVGFGGGGGAAALGGWFGGG